MCYHYKEASWYVLPMRFLNKCSAPPTRGTGSNVGGTHCFRSEVCNDTRQVSHLDDWEYRHEVTVSYTRLHEGMRICT